MNTELGEIRKKLDKIDNILIKLLAERQSYMPAVAKYKKENNLPLTHSKREKEILDAKKQMAEELGLDNIFIESIFKLIFKSSKTVQKKFWK